LPGQTLVWHLQLYIDIEKFLATSNEKFPEEYEPLERVRILKSGFVN
jgi:hypothetical protein